jgi:hypothetical protein
MTMTTLAERICRTPLVDVNGAARILSAAAFLALRERAWSLGQGQWLVSVSGGADDGPCPQDASRWPLTPTVEAITRDRSILDRLPPGVLIELLRQLDHVRTDVKAAIAARQSMPPGAPSAPPPSRAVRLKDAATLRARSPDYLYRNWKKLGGYKDEDGRIKFPAEIIARPQAPPDGAGCPRGG